jgi:glyoxalase family protein
MARQSQPSPAGPDIGGSMQGIHHVTAIAVRASRILAFYARTLGLRFVKKTANFDDPGTYHFYYGDETGSPGSILTFFPRGKAPQWAAAALARH